MENWTSSKFPNMEIFSILHLNSFLCLEYLVGQTELSLSDLERKYNG